MHIFGHFPFFFNTFWKLALLPSSGKCKKANLMCLLNGANRFFTFI
jgi:hypothetical protein